MGADLERRLLIAGQECVVYDVQPEPVRILAKDGAVGTFSLDDFVRGLVRPCVPGPAGARSAHFFTARACPARRTWAALAITMPRLAFSPPRTDLPASGVAVRQGAAGPGGTPPPYLVPPRVPVVT